MPMIRECIVTTLNEEGSVHIAPLGLIVEEGGFIIAPFRPSTTLDNLRVNPYAVANFTDDVLVFAGCLTGRKDWPTRPSTHVPGAVLEGALAHAELAVDHVQEDEQRPRFHCRVVHEASHAAVQGLQPRASRGDRGGDPRQPPAYAAAREDRARARLFADRGGEDGGPARARSLAAVWSRRSRTITSTPSRPPADSHLHPSPSQQESCKERGP